MRYSLTIVDLGFFKLHFPCHRLISIEAMTSFATTPGLQYQHLIVENRKRNGNKNPISGLSLAAAKVKWPLHAPPCQCANCSEDFLTLDQQKYDKFAYVGFFNRQQANQAWTDVFQSNTRDLNQSILKAKIDEKGDDIVDFWIRQPVLERESFSRTVFEDSFLSISEQRWPDIEAFYKDGSPIDKRLDFYENFLLPHVNLIALSEDPSVLLTLIESRASLNPDQLLRVDRREMATGLDTGHIKLQWHGGYLDRIAGGRNVVLTWDPSTTHQRGMIGFPVAKAIRDVLPPFRQHRYLIK